MQGPGHTPANRGAQRNNRVCAYSTVQSDVVRRTRVKGPPQKSVVIDRLDWIATLYGNVRHAVEIGMSVRLALNVGGDAERG